ncbi:hypothetical protein Purlil1_264 [Purpureocillium lilacinum]|uniref:Uncharacterized protein n=1 Tax=Purpureocillium lilacinum TaxID=33203 RepID=A0ABR0CHT3_PURLI|nr:hypothetical protein Purlil1_264 [Purpureocillium lilacinum]
MPTSLSLVFSAVCTVQYYEYDGEERTKEQSPAKQAFHGGQRRRGLACAAQRAAQQKRREGPSSLSLPSDALWRRAPHSGVDQCYTQALSKAITELRLPATTPAHHPHSRSTRLLVAAAPSCEVPPPSGGHTDASHQRHASPDPGRRGNLRTAARFDPVTRDAVGKMPRCRCTRPRGSDACHARPTNGWPTIVARVRSLKVVDCRPVSPDVCLPKDSRPDPMCHSC